MNKSLYLLKWAFLTVTIVLFFWSILNIDQIFINLSYTQIFGTFLSLLGSYFMINRADEGLGSGKVIYYNFKVKTHLNQNYNLQIGFFSKTQTPDL